MPPKGFVGIKLTPQRKLVLNEVMQSEGFRKPSEAIDFAVSLAQDYVKASPDSAEMSELPDFLNYYVGDKRALGSNDNVAPLVKRERISALHSRLTWRLEALAFINAYEPTIVNLSDAIDFALTAYLMHSRAGTLPTERVAEVREQVKRNAVQFREEVQDFLRDNMTDVERNARIAGVKHKHKASRKPTHTYAEKQNALLMGLTHAHRMYRQAVERNADADIIASTVHSIENAEAALQALERTQIMGNIEKARDEQDASAAIKRDDMLPF